MALHADFVRIAQAPPRRSSDWQVLWTTEPSDHENAAITALAYAPALSGLPGGDGHGGWLVSASDRM